MEQETKTCADGFVWLIISYEQVHKLFTTNAIALYTLYHDDSEALIDSVEALEEAIKKELQIGIEVGFFSELSATNGRR